MTPVQVWQEIYVAFMFFFLPGLIGDIELQLPWHRHGFSHGFLLPGPGVGIVGLYDLRSGDRSLEPERVGRL
jgi:hypothetical protein